MEMIEMEKLTKRQISNQNWYKSQSQDKKNFRCEKSKEYFKKYPWIKHFHSAKDRVKNKPRYIGLAFNMSKEDFKLIWERDMAYLMKCPSVDRIEPHKGYILSNCRFLELSENVRRGNHFGRLFKEAPKTNSALRNREYRGRIRMMKELLLENAELKKELERDKRKSPGRVALDEEEIYKIIYSYSGEMNGSKLAAKAIHILLIESNK